MIGYCEEIDPLKSWLEYVISEDFKYIRSKTNNLGFGDKYQLVEDMSGDIQIQDYEEELMPTLMPISSQNRDDGNDELMLCLSFKPIDTDIVKAYEYFKRAGGEFLSSMTMKDCINCYTHMGSNKEYFDAFGRITSRGERLDYDPRIGDMSELNKYWCALVRNSTRFVTDVFSGRPINQEEGVRFNGKTYMENFVDYFQEYNRQYFEPLIYEASKKIFELRNGLKETDSEYVKRQIRYSLKKAESELRHLKKDLANANINIDKIAEEVIALSEEEFQDYLANGGMTYEQ